MKKTTQYRHRDRELEIKMTPMIDIVFLLLVFFVWTASFHVLEDSLPTNLTSQLGEAESSEPLPEIEYDEIVIRIFWEAGPVWTLNDLPLESHQELQSRLRAIHEIKNDTNVIIHPEKSVPMGEVIDVFDVAQLAGFENVQFATAIELNP